MHRLIRRGCLSCRKLSRYVVFIFVILYVASVCAMLMTRQMTASQRTVINAEAKTETATETTSFMNVTTSASEPVLVIILTYQRSGSTFFGQIFNQNPDAFYAFEPLDSLYSAIYGTAQGYNSPSDIVQHWNGTQRTVPEFEIQSAASVLDMLLTCKHDSLPTEMITSIFWVGFKSEHLAVSEFIQCFIDKKISYNNCRGKIKFCKTWFGEKASKQEECRRQLWAETTPNLKPTLREFKAYNNCLNKFRQKASPCFPKLMTACSRAHIRSAKVVRLPMKAVEILLKLHPKRLKVVHLLRDPKAVVLSRMKYESVRGHFAGMNKTAEAVTLCRIIHEDLVIRNRLERLYPGVFYQVVYEEFIRHPAMVTKNIYRHIGRPLPTSVQQFMLSKTSLNNTRPIKGLTKNEARTIDAVCSEVYEKVSYV